MTKERIKRVFPMDIARMYHLPISFKIYNPNPLIDIENNETWATKRNDCTTRTMSILTDVDYDNIWNIQMTLSNRYRVLTSSTTITDEILASYGFKCYKYNGMVLEFILTHLKGKYALCTKDHIFPVVNGCVIDFSYGRSTLDDQYKWIQDVVYERMTRVYVLKEVEL